MLLSLIKKELQAIILSPKFVATFAVCSVLLLLSVYIGINEYLQITSQNQTAKVLSEENMLQKTSWGAVSDKAYRSTEPMQIFVSGLNYDIGRWSEIKSESGILLRNSPYSDDPIFAVFRFIDFSFIVQIVFSLFAILFTFDAVNGERERGTLKLVFSNSVSRVKYVVAKCIGSWLGLVVPLCVPILLSILLVLLYEIPLNAGDWSRLVMLIALSLLYVTLFTVIGVFLSSITQKSSASFLLSLMVWIVLVLIIPRIGVITASHIIDVPGLAEVEARKDSYSKNAWTEYVNNLEDMMNLDGDGDSNETLDEDAMWAQLIQEDSIRREMQHEIDAYEIMIMEDWQNRKNEQQVLGFALSRFSPVSAYQLGAMTLAGTDISMKSRYVDAMNSYRKEFNKFVEEKQDESGDIGGVVITMDSEKGMSIQSSRNNDGLDLDGRPVFTSPVQVLSNVVNSVKIDFLILALSTMLAFAGAFLAIQRFDVR